MARVGPCASAATARGAAALRLGLAPVYLLNRLGGTRRACSRAAPKHSVLAGRGLSVCLSNSPITSKHPGSFFPSYPRLLRTTPLPCTERLKRKVAAETHRGEVTRARSPGCWRRSLPCRCRSLGPAPAAVCFLPRILCSETVGKLHRNLLVENQLRAESHTLHPGQGRGTEPGPHQSPSQQLLCGDREEGTGTKEEKGKNREGTHGKIGLLIKRNLHSVSIQKNCRFQ